MRNAKNTRHCYIVCYITLGIFLLPRAYLERDPERWRRWIAPNFYGRERGGNYYSLLSCRPGHLKLDM